MEKSSLFYAWEGAVLALSCALVPHWRKKRARGFPSSLHWIRVASKSTVTAMAAAKRRWLVFSQASEKERKSASERTAEHAERRRPGAPWQQRRGGADVCHFTGFVYTHTPSRDQGGRVYSTFWVSSSSSSCFFFDESIMFDDDWPRVHLASLHCC